MSTPTTTLTRASHLPAPPMRTLGRFTRRSQTLGGKTFWTDVQSGRGFRLQRFFWNGDHYRILDSADVLWWWDICPLELARRAFGEIASGAMPPRTLAGRQAAEALLLAEASAARVSAQAREDAIAVLNRAALLVFLVGLTFAAGASFLLLLQRWTG